MVEPPVDHPLAGIPPTRPHPAWIVSAALSSVRSLIFAFIAIAFSVRDQGIVVITLAMITPGMLIIGWRALQWRAMRYFARDGSISLSSGLMEKTRRTVQVERVQSVDSLETPISRLLGVSELQIASAGSARPITIPAISADQAERLREWIEATRAGAGSNDVDARSADSPKAPSTVVCQLSGQDVLLAGLTAGRIAPALAIAAAAWRFGSDLLPGSIWDRVPIDPDRLTPASLVALIAVAALMAWGLSIAGAGLSLWDFTVERTADSLTLTRGLLDRKQNTIPVQRIQAISVVEGLLRQPFGYASVMLESAAKTHRANDSSETRYLFPFIRRSDIPSLISTALPEFGWAEAEISWQGLPTRARGRYLVPVVRDFGLVLAATCAVLAVVPQTEWWYGLSLLPLAPAWLGLGWLQFRDAGWAIDQRDRLFVQKRSIEKTLTVTRGRRVQVRELASNPLQRRARLGSVTLRLATIGGRGTMTLKHVDYQDGERLLAVLGPRAQPPPAPVIRG